MIRKCAALLLIALASCTPPAKKAASTATASNLPNHALTVQEGPPAEILPATPAPAPTTQPAAQLPPSQPAVSFPPSPPPSATTPPPAQPTASLPPSPPPPAPTISTIPGSTPVDAPGQDPKGPRPNPQKVVKAEDPPLLIRPVVNLSVYHLSVPVGVVSRNNAFWKHVQEHAVDAATHDILQKNGIRIGIAPLSELQYFLNTLDRQFQAQPALFVTSSGRIVELPMKQGIPSQLIYDFNLKNVMTLRTYEACDNIFLLDFQPAARKAGDVLVRMCPMVRCLRKRLVAIGDEDTREIEFINPERYFDLNLKTELSVDKLLIVGPSAEASQPLSLGHSFLMHEGPTEKLEDVLLIIPQVIKAPNPPATQAPAPPADKKENKDKKDQKKSK